jgi:hypothetical protein
MSLDAPPPSDGGDNDDDRRMVRPISHIEEVRAPKTDEKLDELNNNVLEIGANLKVLINEVKGLKEAINSLADVISQSNSSKL